MFLDDALPQYQSLFSDLLFLQVHDIDFVFGQTQFSYHNGDCNLVIFNMTIKGSKW